MEVRFLKIAIKSSYNDKKITHYSTLKLHRGENVFSPYIAYDWLQSKNYIKTWGVTFKKYMR